MTRSVIKILKVELKIRQTLESEAEVRAQCRTLFDIISLSDRINCSKHILRDSVGFTSNT